MCRIFLNPLHSAGIAAEEKTTETRLTRSSRSFSTALRPERRRQKRNTPGNNCSLKKRDTTTSPPPKEIEKMSIIFPEPINNGRAISSSLKTQRTHHQVKGIHICICWILSITWMLYNQRSWRNNIHNHQSQDKQYKHRSKLATTTSSTLMF